MYNYLSKLLLIICFLCIINIPFQAISQINTDSSNLIRQITVKAYLSNQPVFTLPSSAKIINRLAIDKNSSPSLVSVFNTVSGVKMEERSPGSYRLSIRGSLLRSPFGVRNVKVYYDDFPLTDASGNTYINMLPPSAIQNIEILKGPDGSLFGANSGGVVLLDSQPQTPEFSMGLAAGSYGNFSENITIHKENHKYKFKIHQAFQTAEGYRDHSNLKRTFFQAQEQLQYSNKGNLIFSGFYSDLGYKTPGGLTLAQSIENPTASRLATPTLPSAAEQKAGIYNKSVFGGVRNKFKLSDRINHYLSVSGLITNFKNPFISNYETRDEKSLAIRSYFEIKNEKISLINYQLNLGWEFQSTSSEIINYKNVKGYPTELIASDKIINQYQFGFLRFASQYKKWKGELSSSLNFIKFSFQGLSQGNSSGDSGGEKINPQMMPKVAISYQFNKNFVFRCLLSRGFSAPTSAEIRASDTKINTNLKAESGYNREVGLRYLNSKGNIFLDFSVFKYGLQNAIVRRVNAQDQDYFINSGGTLQKGAEVELTIKLIDDQSGFISQLNLNSAITLNEFKFKSYMLSGVDYSGNLLTGVPQSLLTSSLDFRLKNKLGMFVRYNYQGKTSLNDAQTVFAEQYNLIFINFNYKDRIRKSDFELGFSIDNLTNCNYSLGNDLNAFGARYYNPAPKRNFLINLKFML